MLDSDSDCETVGSKCTTTAINGQSNKVTEREQQMRYLIKMFPKMQSFVCFFVLNKTFLIIVLFPVRL